VTRLLRSGRAGQLTDLHVGNEVHVPAFPQMRWAAMTDCP
jgi:hypothetical protein